MRLYLVIGLYLNFLVDGISETDFEVPDKNHTLLVNNLLIENNITNHNYINMIMNTPEKFSYFIEQLKCLTYEQWKIVYNSWEESIQTREIKWVHFFVNTNKWIFKCKSSYSDIR